MDDKRYPCEGDPCGSCPYRKDTPPGVWDRSEYLKLPLWDEQWHVTGPFLCHSRSDIPSGKESICRGWLEVHERNIGVRMLMRRIDFKDNPIRPTPIPLYDTGAQAARAGLRGIKKPSENAAKVIGRLVKAKKGRTTLPSA